MGATDPQNSSAPARRSILDRLASKAEDNNPLTASSIDVHANPLEETGTFTIGMTGELILDQIAPLPLSNEIAVNLGDLSLEEALEHHLLLVPDRVLPAEIEALAVSVWNEAGWLSPGNLRLRQGSTLEGPWSISSETAAALGLTEEAPKAQVYLVRAPALRGAVPTESVKEFSELARAFPGGMPVGVEERVLDFLQRVCRRLGGALRIAGSGYLLHPEFGSSINLRVYASSWLSPQEMVDLLGPYFPGLWNPGPPPAVEGGPFALMAPIASRSQVLIGVRMEQMAPRALRWEMWAKERMFVYEIVWVRPEDLMKLDQAPTRSGRLERNRAATSIETAAALLADQLSSPIRGGAAIIDEDQFLVGLDVPPQEEEQPHL